MSTYLLVIVAMLVLTFSLSNWSLNEPASNVLREIAKWATFTILDSPDINRISGTYILVAGVTWSLPYEWFYYLSLPTLALLSNRSVSLPFALLSIGSLGYLVMWSPMPMHLYAFLGGMVAAGLGRCVNLQLFSRTRTASVIVIAIFCTVVLLYPTAYRIGALALLSCTFVLIASGCSLFGLLETKASRYIGGNDL